MISASPPSQVFSLHLNEEEEHKCELAKKQDACAICEEYITKALDFLTKNKTQDEIIDILFHTCHKLHPLGQQQIAKISSQVQEDSCGFCRDAVSELLVKLKDPYTELDIIEKLLKGCNSMEKYAQKCKRLVFVYGPVMLVKAEKFLERTDICTTLHACKASTINMEAKDMKETLLICLPTLNYGSKRSLLGKRDTTITL